MFRCEQCGKVLHLDYQRIEVDMLVKDYLCRNEHKTVMKRYGRTIEVNGRKIQASRDFDLFKAQKTLTLKKENDYKLEQLRK